MTTKNLLPFIDVNNTETGCCPVFDPEPWNEKTFELDKMLFAKASTKSFLHMPLNMGKVFTHAQASIDAANANLESGYLILSQDKSSWSADHYFRVSKEVPDLESVNISGTFMTKTFDGPFKDVPKFLNETEVWIGDQGHKMKESFIFYTTCPKCAKHYGHNYMVIFGRI